MAQAFVTQFEPYEPSPAYEPPPRELGMDIPSVYARLAPVVRRVVFALLGPDQEREDLMHEIFIRVFLGVHRLRDPERLEPWAARVAINTVKNELRRRRLRRCASWDPVLEPDRLVAHSDFETRNVALHAARAIEQLPERERALLLRRWFQPTTTDSLASDADCSARTIKRRLQRAQNRFDRMVRRDASLCDWLATHGADESESEGEDGDAS